jgi:acetolactate synthase-1/2/3 large subunit
MDFRLAFGGSFGEETELVVIDRAEPTRAHPRRSRPSSTAGLPAILDALREGAKDGEDTGAWVSHLREQETAKRAKETEELEDPRSPCTRCGSTRSSARCSTATRSSSATAATSSPTPAA